MRSRHPFSALVALTVFASQFAYAQNQKPYYGPKSGLEQVKRPESIDGNCRSRFEKDANALSACLAALRPAELMAQARAGGLGRIDGFKKGYAWGLRDGINNIRRVPNLYSMNFNAGRDAVNSGQNYLSLIQRFASEAAYSPGEAQGSSAGEQEAVRKFTASLDTGTFPTRFVDGKTLDLEHRQYQSRYQVSGAYNPYLQTVGTPRSEQDFIRGISGGPVSVYKDHNPNLLGQVSEWKPGDYFTKDGEYIPARNEAFDGRKALKLWIARVLPNSNSDLDLYDKLKTLSTSAGTKGEAGGKQDQGVAGTKGNPLAGIPGPGPETKDDAVTAPVNYQQVFDESFITAYEQLAPSYYTAALNSKALSDGQAAGFSIGTQAGQQLAYQDGIVATYNSRFALAERSQFELGFRNGFNQSFGKTFDRYQNFPQLGISDVRYEEGQPDENWTPNELVKVSFILKNYGGVQAEKVCVSLKGDVSGQNDLCLNVKALSSLKVTSEPLGKIDLGTRSVEARSGTRASINLNVNDIVNADSLYVRNQVTPGVQTSSPDFAKGVVTVQLPFKNNSKVRSYDAIRFLVTDSLGRTQDLPQGFVQNRGELIASATLSGFDPLDLIDGKVSIKGQLFMGSELIGEAVYTIQSENKYTSIAAAFDLIAQGADDAQKFKLMDRIYQEVHAEATSAGVSEYENMNTQLWNLVQTKKSHLQTQAAKDAYHELAGKLKPVESEMKGARITLFGLLDSRSVNQKWFEREIQELENN